jgi:AraC family transcriptional activator of pobA
MKDSLAIKVNKKLDGEQRFKISRFKEVIKRTKPHKHDSYFEIIYLSEGAGFHWIDTQKFQIAPPVAYFLSGQLHYWEMTSIPKGYVLLFKEEFFDLLKQSDLLHLIHSMNDIVNVDLSPDDGLDLIFEDMEREYKNPSIHSTALIQGYLQVVLIKLLRHKEAQDIPLRTSGTEQVFRRFVHLVQNTHPISNLKVNHYAELLNVSPQNLNAIARKASGKTAGELISEQVTLEAKRYLLHTDKTVSEIAFALNFTDPSHFVKYFKKLSGETPQTFRSRHFQ